MVLRKHIWEEKSKRRQEALMRAGQLDDLEDRRGLEEKEEKEQRAGKTLSREKIKS